MKTIGLNEYGQVEDSTIAEGMAYIEKPFRETQIKGLKKLFILKTIQILIGEKLAEKGGKKFVNSFEGEQIIEKMRMIKIEKMADERFEKEWSESEKEYDKKQEERKIIEEQERLAREEEKKWLKENPEDAERLRLFEEFLANKPKEEELKKLLLSTFNLKNSAYKTKLINLVLNIQNSSFFLLKAIEANDEEVIKASNDIILDYLVKMLIKYDQDHINKRDLNLNYFEEIFKLKAENCNKTILKIRQLCLEIWEKQRIWLSDAYDLGIETQRVLVERFGYDLPLVKIMDSDDNEVYKYVQENFNYCGSNKSSKQNQIINVLKLKYGNIGNYCSKMIELKGVGILSEDIFYQKNYITGYLKINEFISIDIDKDYISEKALFIIAKEVVERRRIFLPYVIPNTWEECYKQLQEGLKGLTVYSKKFQPILQIAINERMCKLKKEYEERMAHIGNIKDKLLNV